MPSSPPRLLSLAGSLRRDSFNARLARAAAGLARAAGADVLEVDLREYRLPVFDQDLEAESGMPEAASRLKALLSERDGCIVASPEYNGSITPVLKNTIDWMSRSESKDEPPLSAFRGKTVLLVSASPGALGGLRGLVHVRDILGNIGCIVLPREVALSRAHEAFDEAGELRDTGQATRLGQAVEALVDVTSRLRTD